MSVKASVACQQLPVHGAPWHTAERSATTTEFQNGTYFKNTPRISMLSNIFVMLSLPSNNINKVYYGILISIVAELFSLIWYWIAASLDKFSHTAYR